MLLLLFLFLRWKGKEWKHNRKWKEIFFASLSFSLSLLIFFLLIAIQKISQVCTLKNAWIFVIETKGEDYILWIFKLTQLSHRYLCIWVYSFSFTHYLLSQILFRVLSFYFFLSLSLFIISHSRNSPCFSAFSI